MLKKMAIVLVGIFVSIFVMGSMNLTAAQSYKVVQIKEQLNSWGYYPRSIYSDSDCMCGQDWPHDYIFEFYVPGAYNKRNDLKITTTNNTSSCYINNYVSARVYSNDVIKACVGYWTAFLCRTTSPSRYDVAIWY